jgi:Holliday junction resolvasome RuvABC endonuclease subunit
MVDNHSARFARLHSHYVNLRMTFEYTRPVIVVCESPFFNAKRPQAYGALVETLSAVRRALWEYDPYMQLYLIDPPRVKRAVGAAGNAGKDDMRTAVLKLAQELRYQGPVPLECIDEHSIDAIAVGYSKLVEFRTGV